MNANDSPMAEALGQVPVDLARAWDKQEPEEYTKLVVRQISFLAFQECKRLLEGRSAPLTSPLTPEYFQVHGGKRKPVPIGEVLAACFAGGNTSGTSPCCDQPTSRGSEAVVIGREA